MTWAVAFAMWVTLAAGAYLALSRDVLRCVVGLALLGNAVNLLLLVAGRLGPVQPAVVEAGRTVLEGAANPLPQALVLTAIVIGFALMCFALVLTMQLVRRAGTDDALALRFVEPEPTDPVKPPRAHDEPADEPVQSEGVPAGATVAASVSATVTEPASAPTRAPTRAPTSAPTSAPTQGGSR
ncbi:MAG: NADH-quinone oxidoreductase subunit K [Rubrivivax sp.]|nr:NADH-quinone oxidoreductase subunit K [Rubrivivax sp.]